METRKSACIKTLHNLFTSNVAHAQCQYFAMHCGLKIFMPTLCMFYTTSMFLHKSQHVFGHVVPDFTHSSNCKVNKWFMLPIMLILPRHDRTMSNI